jgi:succinoglycan biosynthesis protein ExoO
VKNGSSFSTLMMPVTPERLERLTRAASDLNADVVLDNFAWYDATKNSVGSPGISPSSTVEVIDKYEFAMRARPYTDEADWGLLQPMLRRRFLDEHNLRCPLFSRHGEDFLFMIDLLMAGADLSWSERRGISIRGGL